MNINYKTEKITNPEIIKTYLERYNDYFNPPLTNICNLSEYAEKLGAYANNYVFKDEQNNIIGFIAFYNNDNKNKIGYLTLIVVDVLYSGKGCGNILLNEFENKCKENNIKSLKLEVNKLNKHAMDFYVRNGYVFAKEKENSYYMTKIL